MCLHIISSRYAPILSEARRANRAAESAASGAKDGYQPMSRFNQHVSAVAKVTAARPSSIFIPPRSQCICSKVASRQDHLKTDPKHKTKGIYGSSAPAMRRANWDQVTNGTLFV
jgi:hypothetical protein